MNRKWERLRSVRLTKRPPSVTCKRFSCEQNEPKPTTTTFIVEFIVPHYFAGLFASQYPDEHGGFGAQVFFRNEENHVEQVIGDVSFFENRADPPDWMIRVEYPDGGEMRTFIENVERIVVL